MQKRRPAAQRIQNLESITDNFRTRKDMPDKYDVAKSEPDLVDANYVEFRRPWYGNPNYRGPRNVILSSNQLQSPVGSVYSIQSVQTIQRSKYPTMFRTSEKQINRIRDYDHIPRRKKSSNTESECQDGNAFFSFENLMGVGTDNFPQCLKLSSSPESAISIQNSSGRSSGRKNRNIKRQIRSKTSSISPRFLANDADDLINKASGIIKPTMSPLAYRSENKKLIGNYSRLIVGDQIMNRSTASSERDSGVPCDNDLCGDVGRLLADRCLDDRMIKTWEKRTSIQSEESDLTSVTDDDFSNSSALSRSSYQRPVPSTYQGQCEALFYVFTYLDMKSLARCGGVNRQWHNISREPVLWRKIRINDSCISPNTFISMTKWCIKVKEISLQKIRTVGKLMQPKKITEFDQNAIEASLMKLFKLNKESIKTIRIIDCDGVITSRILWYISTCCRYVTKLVYLSKSDPLGQEDLFPLGRGCPGITSLIIPPGWPCAAGQVFNDACCETISKYWEKLQVLCIGGCAITINGLQLIAKGCIKLQHLEIDHGPEITEEGASKMVSLGLRGLEKLDFTFTPVSPRAAVIFNNACPKLVHIGVHCNIANYFSDHNSTKSKANFNSLKTLFRRLKTRAGFKNVLEVNLDYEVDTATT